MKHSYTFQLFMTKEEQITMLEKSIADKKKKIKILNLVFNGIKKFQEEKSQKQEVLKIKNLEEELGILNK